MSRCCRVSSWFSAVTPYLPLVICSAAPAPIGWEPDRSLLRWGSARLSSPRAAGPSCTLRHFAPRCGGNRPCNGPLRAARRSLDHSIGKAGSEELFAAVWISGFPIGKWLVVEKGVVGDEDPVSRANGDHIRRVEYPQNLVDRRAADTKLDTLRFFHRKAGTKEHAPKRIASDSRSVPSLERGSAAHRGELTHHRPLAISPPLVTCWFVAWSS